MDLYLIASEQKGETICGIDCDGITAVIGSRELSARWKWSASTVQRFLRAIANLGSVSISQVKRPASGTITVIQMNSKTVVPEGDLKKTRTVKNQVSILSVPSIPQEARDLIDRFNTICSSKGLLDFHLPDDDARAYLNITSNKRADGSPYTYADVLAIHEYLKQDEFWTMVSSFRRLVQTNCKGVPYYTTILQRALVRKKPTNKNSGSRFGNDTRDNIPTKKTKGGLPF